MSTNESQATPSRQQIIMTATYYAAVEGYYDTSETAQATNLLTIDVLDMASHEPLPEGATHRFYVMINATGYMVTRYPDETYKVEAHDRIEKQSQERELRDAVLDCALWYMTGEGAGYHPRQGADARAAAIKELLEEGPENQEERKENDPLNHPVVREEQPDPTISLAPGSEGGPLPHVLRQWTVQIGPYNGCSIAFFGYDAEDNSPVLIAMDTEDDNEEE